ncbi:MAG TPA: cation diffusion facilitator family transporter [Methanospirillum sp.]|nr:cation diffusion facilitator family transporter [Methanospirillum sp.]
MSAQFINPSDEKTTIARLSVISNTGLLLLKLIVGLALGSVSIISEAIHSGMDLIAAIIAFFSVRKSAIPADDDHAFGHGKYESISGLVEAILIFIAAALIIREAVVKLLEPGEELLDPTLMLGGIAVMGISALVNAYVSNRLMKVAKATDSVALESDAWHLRTDVYTSLGVFAGLVLIRLTGIMILDSIVAIGVALVIMKAAFDLTTKTWNDIIDHRLSDDEEHRIRAIICEHASDYMNFHGLRTRRSGPELFMEFHLVVDGTITVQQSHDLTDHLESDLKIEFPRASVTIHVEPCQDSCTECSSLCDIGKTKRSEE